MKAIASAEKATPRTMNGQRRPSVSSGATAPAPTPTASEVSPPRHQVDPTQHRARSGILWIHVEGLPERAFRLVELTACQSIPAKNEMAGSVQRIELHRPAAEVEGFVQTAQCQGQKRSPAYDIGVATSERQGASERDVRARPVPVVESPDVAQHLVGLGQIRVE